MSLRAPEWAVSAVMLLTMGPASADPVDDPAAKLHEVEGQLGAARQDQAGLQHQDAGLAAEIASLRQRSVDVARVIQQNEDRIVAAEAALAAAEAQLRAKTSELGRHRGDEVRVVSALERLSVAPPEAGLLGAGHPVDLARGGMVLAALLPRLRDEAEATARDEAEIERSRAGLAEERASILRQQETLDQQSTELQAILAERQAKEATVHQLQDAAQRKVAQLAAQAGDLKHLVERIEQERAAAAQTPASVDHAAAIGTGFALAAPASGPVTGRFGTPGPAGPAKGIGYQTVARARVTAPADGQVMFAGPFKGYGQILIIDHGDGYHSLLAGIDHLDTRVGARVVAGEPVGSMSSDKNPALYMELRRQGEAVDPQPYLPVRMEGTP